MADIEPHLDSDNGTAVARGVAPITRATPCMQCGYDLRGLRVDSECPECRLPAARSHGVPHLVNTDRAWLITLERGSRFLMAAALVLFAPSLIVLLGMPTVFGFAVVGCTLITIVLIACGMYRLTAPEPGTPATEGNNSAREIARFCALATPFSMVCIFVLPPPIIAIMTAVAVVFLISALAAGLHLLSQLSERLSGQLALSRAARRARYGLIACGLLAVALTLLIFTSWSNGTLAGLAWLACYIVMLVSLVQFGRFGQALTPVIRAMPD